MTLVYETVQRMRELASQAFVMSSLSASYRSSTSLSPGDLPTPTA